MSERRRVVDKFLGVTITAGATGYGRRNSAILLSRCLLLLAGVGLVMASLCLVAPVGAAERRFSPIIDFSDPADTARISVEKANLSFVQDARVGAGATAARVEFANADWPQLLIQPTGQAWDWSEMQALAIAVQNPTADSVDLVVRLEDDLQSGGPEHSVTGRTRLQPGEAVALILPLQSSNARAMGMLAGPPPETPRLDAPARVVGGLRGGIDLRRVRALRLMLARPGAPRTLVFGEPGTIHGGEAGRERYQRIVDMFGQYARGQWSGKIGSSADLQEERRREQSELQDGSASLPPLDRYGGLLQGPRFAATGFFRVEQRDDRWWLVTPEGYGFFSLGIDVVRPDVGATYVEGREFMFAGLPAPNDPLAAHYGEADHRLGLPVQQGRGFDHGRTFDFHAANLERKYGPSYLDAWRHTAIARLRAWGFNTIGNWSELALLARRELAYVLPIHLYGDYAQLSSGSDWWGRMPDAFDPRFAASVDAQIVSVTSSYRNDPFLIGYFVDNELAWGLGSSPDPQLRYGLAVDALRRGADSPAKQAFLRMLVEKYNRIAELNADWGVAFASWEELIRSDLMLSPQVLARPQVVVDLGAFSTRYAEAYFRTVAEAIRRHDPHHLYLGSRFQARTPEAIAACAKYCDVVSFNVYQREIAGEEWQRFHSLGKPALIGEFQFGSVDRGLFWPGIYDVGLEEQRGAAYATYLRSVLADPDFVGCHWFQYVDEPLTGRLLDGENGHVGFVSVADIPYSDLVSAARRANLDVLRSLH